MKWTGLLCALCLVLNVETAAAVPITFTLSSSLLSSVPGATVTFTGTITETGGSVAFLNGDNFTVASPLSLNDTLFFLNTPPLLTSLQSITAPFFTVFVPAGTAPGLYSGTFTILGGTSPASFTTLGSQQFAVSVTEIPEPGAAWLLLLSGATHACRVARRRLNR
jgi:hypothetical protein